MPSIETAVVLCGGESTRAGRDKQLLPCGDTTLPIAIARKLAERFGCIVIATNRPELYVGTGFLVVEDAVKAAGPLGGILGALRRAPGDYAYVTAGDMPYQNLAYIDWMMRELEAVEVDAAAARDGGGYVEPFNSFFSLRCAASIEGYLARGERSVGRFLESRKRLFLVPEVTARSFSPDWSMFWNINTREDVEEYLHFIPDRMDNHRLKRHP